MDEQHLLHACELVSEGKYREAYDEFMRLAENTPDPLEKAWPLIYAANALQTLGKDEAATAQLLAARTLIEGHRPSNPATNEKFAAAELFLDFEDADIFWQRGSSLEAALNRFDEIVYKHRLALKDPGSSDLCDAIQIRRAFILSDLDRWEEALQILQQINQPKEFEKYIAPHLGHCYLVARNYIKAEEALTQALTLGGLPPGLECRAHFELGVVYYNLQKNAQAKSELEQCIATAGAGYLQNSVIWNYLGRTSYKLGDFVAARKAFEKLLALNPEEPLRTEACRWLGITLYELGQVARAAAQFEACLASPYLDKEDEHRIRKWLADASRAGWNTETRP